MRYYEHSVEHTAHKYWREFILGCPTAQIAPDLEVFDHNFDSGVQSKTTHIEDSDLIQNYVTSLKSKLLSATHWDFNEAGCFASRQSVPQSKSVAQIRIEYAPSDTCCDSYIYPDDADPIFITHLWFAT